MDPLRKYLAQVVLILYHYSFPDKQLSSSRWSLWAPALSVLLATTLLAVGGIIWYLISKWKGTVVIGLLKVSFCFIIM